MNRQIAGLSIPSASHLAKIKEDAQKYSDRLVIARNLVVLCDLVEAMYAALLSLTQIIAHNAYEARKKRKRRTH